MPQVLAVMMVGAGIYSALRWVGRELEAAADAARRQAEELERRTRAAVPKDLGALEFDPATNVYRPRSPA